MINKLSIELKEAMKLHDSEKVGVLRLLISALKNKKIELLASGKELTEEEALKVIKSEAKKRKDSIEAYEKAGRTDLSNEEKTELAIIEKYLPEQMSESDIEKVVDEVIASFGTDGGLGAIMGSVMSKLGGQADGKVVRNIVTKKLNG